jgi:hypothetical protein
MKDIETLSLSIFIVIGRAVVVVTPCISSISILCFFELHIVQDRPTTNNQLPASPIFSQMYKREGGGPRQNGKWAGKRPVSLCWALRRDRCYFVSERLFFFLFHFIWSFVSFHLPPFPLTDNKQNGQLFLSEKNFVCVSRLLLLSLFFSLRILVEYNLLTRDGRQRFKRCFNLVLYSSAQSPLATLYILDIYIVSSYTYYNPGRLYIYT